MNLRVKGQTPRESGFARALTAHHPATRSERSTGVSLGGENGERINSVACEEVREGERVRAARGYGGPWEWVLTAALGEAARGSATRRREIRGRECNNI